MKEEARKIRFNETEFNGEYVKRAEEILTALPFWPVGGNIEECAHRFGINIEEYAYQLYLKDQEDQENTQLEVAHE